MEEKLIANIRHIKVMCIECKGMCWTQPMSLLAKSVYRCHTCTEPKEMGYGKPLDVMKDMQFD
jgi:hypothetical protein